MKSFNSINQVCYRPDIFTSEVMVHIKSDGFELRNNDSYCHSYDANIKCYHRYASTRSDDTIGIYIFETGIGIDIDYECGGNMNTYFYPFHDSESFTEAYDYAVDKVNEY